MKNDGLEIRLAHDLSRKITEQVVTQKVDFGIVVNPWAHPDLVIRPLAMDAVTLYQSKTTDSAPGILILDPDLLQSQYILRRLKSWNFTRTIHSPIALIDKALLPEGRLRERLSAYSRHRLQSDVELRFRQFAGLQLNDEFFAFRRWSGL